MARTLGKPQPSLGAPAAARASRPGWRDPRLWIGVAVVAACVVAGSRVLASADDTVTVWTLASDQPSGARLDSADLRAAKVHFADPADVAPYWSTQETLPDPITLSRPVSAGELLTRAATATPANTHLMQVPLSLDPSAVPGSLAAGQVVDVYVAGEDTPVLTKVSVVSVSVDDVSGATALTVAAPDDAVSAYVAALGRQDTKLIVVGRSG